MFLPTAVIVVLVASNVSGCAIIAAAPQRSARCLTDRLGLSTAGVYTLARRPHARSDDGRAGNWQRASC